MCSIYFLSLHDAENIERFFPPLCRKARYIAHQLYIHLDLFIAQRTTPPHDPDRLLILIPAHSHLAAPFAELLYAEDAPHLRVEAE